MADLRGVILDVDGTLLDSNDAHARAWLAALAEANVRVTFPQVRQCIGVGADKLLPRLAHFGADSPQGERVSRRRSEIFEQCYLGDLQPFPKTRELLLALRDRGLALTVASSAERGDLERFLAIARVDDLLQDATSASDAQRSKPDPDVVQAALSKLGFAPTQVVMIGDTKYDIEAASRVEVATIAFRCGGTDEAELAGALAIFDDPADLLERFSASPFCQSHMAC